MNLSRLDLYQVFFYLDESFIKKEDIVESEKVTETDLLMAHSEDYLESLKVIILLI